ncbi:DNA-binding transcriptional LysR family regulator [Streptomonospora nanhaiensis]|uniref:DNA-binding transcriptional LysR family regulator n=1 Tax=Streptomonospora nanhaiensis TaxID=1323731 RepID=A0A853BP18_9ACTN|nr:LysR family transcriptional regulator [Streptomonospora nanhaiensis]NYI97389.1 DNA-binding transcriptional LysR family regulator [Streptomonospora nanhaiensis]
MAQNVESRELECFLVLAEELHFGRAAERLLVSQSRVSQLLRALERRVGARLVERTSRRVRLTPLGADLYADLAPAYAAVRSAVERTRSAAREVAGVLRVGFQGTVYRHMTAAIARFHERYPECRVSVVELPLSDPFGALYRGEVEAATVLMPVAEDGLTVGATFSQRQRMLAVGVGHPFARRAGVDVEDLARVALVPFDEPAPAYWRGDHAPDRTPQGRPIAHTEPVKTLQEGLTLVAAGAGGMLVCRPTADYHRRDDVVYVPVTGMTASALALVWPTAAETAVVRAFRSVVAETLGPAEARADGGALQCGEEEPSAVPAGSVPSLEGMRT